MALPITKENIQVAQNYLRRAIAEGWPVENISATASQAPVRPGHVPEAVSQEARDLAAVRAGVVPVKVGEHLSHDILVPAPPGRPFADGIVKGAYAFYESELPKTKTLTTTKHKLKALTDAEVTVLIKLWTRKVFLDNVADNKVSALRQIVREEMTRALAREERTRALVRQYHDHGPILPPVAPPKHEPQWPQVFDPDQHNPLRPLSPIPNTPPLPPCPSDFFKQPIRRVEDPNCTVTKPSIEEQLWDLMPPLSAKALMCPCCHKQMKIGLIPFGNSLLAQFTLNCCFGSAILTTVSRERMEARAKFPVKEVLSLIQSLRSSYEHD